MTTTNYCLIKKNKLYEDLYEILEDEELIMDNVNHKEKIKYKIEQLTKLYFNDKIKISKNFNSSTESLEDLMIEIADNIENEEKKNNLQGNTLLMYADNDAMYEIVFMEEVGIENLDLELNQMASISNIELAPIYGNIAIIKTLYNNNQLVNSQITNEDVENLIMYNFYHKGVMINSDEKMFELEFSGDNPNIIIGGKFKQLAPFQMFGLMLVGYNEEGQELNKLATKIFGSEIKGRFYLTTMCPITNKRFWNLDIQILNNIIKLINYSMGTIEEKKQIENINNELSEDKLKNPFFLIKKYSV